MVKGQLCQPRPVSDLHDNVTWLQLPESFTFSVPYANWGNCDLNPTRTLLNNTEK